MHICGLVAQDLSTQAFGELNVIKWNSQNFNVT